MVFLFFSLTFPSPISQVPYFHPECLGWWCLHPGAILPGGAPRGDVEGAGVSAMGWTTLFSWRRGPSSPSPWTGSLFSPALCSPCLGGPVESQCYVSFLCWIPEISAHELKKAVCFVGQWFCLGFSLPPPWLLGGSEALCSGGPRHLSLDPPPLLSQVPDELTHTG